MHTFDPSENSSPQSPHNPPARSSDVETAEFERQLVAAKAGCNESIGKILASLRTYMKMVAAAALSSRSVANPQDSDIVQMAQLETSRNIASFRGTSRAQFIAWVRTILLNKVIEAQKVAIREKTNPTRQYDSNFWFSLNSPAANAPSRDPSPSSVISRNEKDEQLRVALKSLPEKYRTAIIRRSFNSETFETIAADWNCSADAVRKLWFRAIIKLQEKIQDISK